MRLLCHFRALRAVVPGDVRRRAASNAAFVKMIGQPIPDTWRSGVHFHAVDVNVFSPGEVVVVSRSNGTKTFGVVEKTTSVRLHTARFCLGALPCLFGVR